MNFFRAYIFLSKDLLITLVNYFIWKYSYFDRAEVKAANYSLQYT